jgi:hypothetical protein
MAIRVTRGIRTRLIAATLIAGVTAIASAGDPAAPSACTGVGYRQFDFWLGEWDVFDVGSSNREATATITAVQGGCAVREEYQGLNGGGGESLSMYDPQTETWRQSWISNKGQIVLIAGKKIGDAITLTGAEYGTAQGRLIRGTWSPVSGAVRETAERSSDGGRSWTPWFDIIFRPRDSKQEGR